MLVIKPLPYCLSLSLSQAIPESFGSDTTKPPRLHGFSTKGEFCDFRKKNFALRLTLLDLMLIMPREV